MSLLTYAEANDPNIEPTTKDKRVLFAYGVLSFGLRPQAAIDRLLEEGVPLSLAEKVVELAAKLLEKN